MSAPASPSTEERFRARNAVRTDLLLGIDQVLLGTAVTTGEGHAPSVETVENVGGPGGGRPVAPTATPRNAPEIPAPAGDTPAERLESLRTMHASACPHCTGETGARTIVFGEGAPDARLMFVGEAPGAEEDRTGRPFVGAAGQKLDEMIKAMGWEREAVYIANVLKSRPPENRTPLEHEITACSPYLAEQVRIIRPEVIVGLGGPASKLLLDTTRGITRLRGVWGTYRAGDLEVAVMPTFHPAYLLRNYTQEIRSQVWQDLQAVMTRLG